MRSFDIGAVCDIGSKKTTNQDRILALVGERKGEEFGIFAVADGIGGLDFGEIASELAVNSIMEWWKKRIALLAEQSNVDFMEKVNEELDALIYKINKDIFEYGKRNGKSGGTTLSLIFIYENDFLIKHTGDSRIYMFYNNLIQLTSDQSWTGREVTAGRLTEKQAAMHPKRNILTMCLGVFEKVEIQTQRGNVPINTVFILCSDGLYGYFNNDKLAKYMSDIKINASLSPQQFANKLLADVISRGARDNISIIIIACRVQGFLHIFEHLIRKLKK